MCMFFSVNLMATPESTDILTTFCGLQPHSGLEGFLVMLAQALPLPPKVFSN